MNKRTALRALPAVEKVIQALGDAGLPRPLLTDLVRRELAALRARGAALAFEAVTDRVRATAADLLRGRLQPVINATGVLIHTNLGRSPLPAAAIETLRAAVSGYCNLEIDLAEGERGHRGAYVERALALLCGAEAATVVNNCAAALVLTLRRFVRPPREEVVISRGELVQIGGGFRIPEILEASGARLREVGTTNRTTLQDYARGLGPRAALVLKVHRSNFFMSGFVESPPLEDIAALARRKRVPFLEDLGSGAVVATERWAGLEHEPTPAEALRRGADLVCFSGDKLLGGPQAGILAGKAKQIAALKTEPFFRALRCDKLVLAALQATAELYLGRAEANVPVLQMLGVPVGELRARAERLRDVLAGLPAQVGIAERAGQVGGGTLPRCAVPSIALEIVPETIKAQNLAARLRRHTPPILGCVAGARCQLHLRTVFPDQDAALAAAVRAALVAG
jgi:L-seryl-tRNA(Ser) seleniumtransferase